MTDMPPEHGWIRDVVCRFCGSIMLSTLVKSAKLGYRPIFNCENPKCEKFKNKYEMDPVVLHEVDDEPYRH